MAFKMKGFSGFGNSPFPSTDPTDKEKIQSDYAAIVNDDSEYGGLSKSQIRKEKKRKKKEENLKNKEQKKMLKRFGGDQAKLDDYNARQAQRAADRQDYLYDTREQRARLGLGYNVLTDDNTGYSYVSPKQHRDQNKDLNNDGVISKDESLKWATDIKGRSTDLGTDFNPASKISKLSKNYVEKGEEREGGSGAPKKYKK